MQEVICRKEIILKSTYFVVVFPRIVCNNCKRIAKKIHHHIIFFILSNFCSGYSQVTFTIGRI